MLRIYLGELQLMCPVCSKYASLQRMQECKKLKLAVKDIQQVKADSYERSTCRGCGCSQEVTDGVRS